ncbi:hypothetical protein L3X38_024910 [Prunus dulcis]|uniref:Uncharacterized protein n=1 Tax=Prunus dulcis TaxID=3755 RepID=A0AAD4Z5V3_PRUDU|nr:hypothetical protein L3X38_024910 [Prunus dulcis]
MGWNITDFTTDGPAPRGATNGSGASTEENVKSPNGALVGGNVKSPNEASVGGNVKSLNSANRVGGRGSIWEEERLRDEELRKEEEIRGRAFFLT